MGKSTYIYPPLNKKYVFFFLFCHSIGCDLMPPCPIFDVHLRNVLLGHGFCILVVFSTYRRRGLWRRVISPPPRARDWKPMSTANQKTRHKETKEKVWEGSSQLSPPISHPISVNWYTMNCQEPAVHYEFQKSRILYARERSHPLICIIWLKST